MENSTPTPTNSTSTPPPHRKLSIWRLFFGAIIILFGFQLLAANYGWNWALSINIWALWPLVIIFVGVSMLMRARSIPHWLGNTVAIVVVVGALALAIFTARPVSRDLTTTDISVPTNATATSMAVSLDIGAGNLWLHGGATVMLSGTWQSNMSGIRNDVSTIGTQQVIHLSQSPSTSQWWLFTNMKNDLSLAVTDTLPVELTLSSGAAKADLDLRTVQLTRATIKTGASTVDLQLGDHQTTSDVSVDAGASTIHVMVPKTVGTRVTIDGGAITTHVPATMTKIANGLYESDGYATAVKHINVTVHAGASTITVETI